MRITAQLVDTSSDEQLTLLRLTQAAGRPKYLERIAELEAGGSVASRPRVLGGGTIYTKHLS